jgi:CDP-diacylglycerol--glycerol-3-phosphate 3-phosphatidyltransferase|tara:strand:+ start:602 stop:1138 length:537 start_codon:yes stop_codon:yes gene_type:complete
MNNFIQILTYFRIFAGPIIFFLIVVFESYGIALFILLLASASDYWDGYLARKYSLTSVLGAVLDPIADKILITFVLIGLILALDSTFIAFLGSIMLAREFWVGALRDFNARNGNEAATTVTFLAKIKTTMQLATFCWMLTGLYLNNGLMIFVGDFFLILALIITLQTGLSYTIATFRR